MHFTRGQLRELGALPEVERPPLPEIDAYGDDRRVLHLLSALTSEAHVIRLASIPRSNDGPKPIEEVRRRVVKITGANDEQIQPENFYRDMTVLPKDLVNVDTSDRSIKLTPAGDTALALGGILLSQFSLKMNQRLRHWTGSKMVRGASAKEVGLSTPQLHRIHIISSLLPNGTTLTALDLTEGTDGLEYRNALGILERMRQLSIFDQIEVKRNPPKYGWRLSGNKRRAAETLLGILQDYSSTEIDPTQGISEVDDILTLRNGSVARTLFRRGLISAGNGTRFEPVTFNDRLSVVFCQLPPGTMLSASQIGELLGEQVSIERMRRQVDKPGCRTQIICKEIPHPSGFWYKFGVKPGYKLKSEKTRS